MALRTVVSTQVLQASSPSAIFSPPPHLRQPSEIPTSRELGPVLPITHFLLESLENLKENRLSLISWVSHPVGFTRQKGAGPAHFRESARALPREQKHNSQPLYLILQDRFSCIHALTLLTSQVFVRLFVCFEITK